MRRGHTRKTIMTSGRTRGVVSFRKGLNVQRQLETIKPFEFKHWLKRFWQPGTSNEERYGMVLAIPYLDLTAAEEVVMAREMLMRLADGLAEHMSGIQPLSSAAVAAKTKRVDPLRLRIEAWFMLAEHYFGPRNEPFISARLTQEGFIEDMLAFFSKNAANRSRSNFDVIIFTEDEGQEDGSEQPVSVIETFEDLMARATVAHSGMLEYLKSFFQVAWDYRERMEYFEASREEVEKTNERIDNLRFELFETLVGIAPEWIMLLSWNKHTFVEITECVLSRTERHRLIDLATLNTDTCAPKLVTWAEVSRIMIGVALKNNWSAMNVVMP